MFWDTAGQEQFHSVAAQFVVRATSCILVYDLTRPVSGSLVHYLYTCFQYNQTGKPVIKLSVYLFAV